MIKTTHVAIKMIKIREISSYRQNQQSSYRNKENTGKPVSFVSTYFDQDQPEDLNSKSLQQEESQELLL